MNHPNQYMTDEAIAFIESMTPANTWRAIFDAMKARGMPLPANADRLRERWEKRKLRPVAPPAPSARKCLGCQTLFQPEHRFNFLCRLCGGKS